MQAAKTCARCGDFLCIYCIGHLADSSAADLCSACAQRAVVERIARGRIKAFTAAAILLVPDVALIVWSFVLLGPASLPAKAIRLALECALVRAFLKGAGWARWLSVALCVLAGVGSLIALTPLTFALGAVYLLGAWLMLDKETLLYVGRAEHKAHSSERAP